MKKVKVWLRFVSVLLFRIFASWYLLRLAGFEYDPYQVALILLTLWVMMYGSGGERTVNNYISYGESDANKV